MTSIEQEYVIDTYEFIANEFSSTRYNVWGFVKDFLLDKEHLYGLDIGCGNGKNMIYDNMVGIDTSKSFVNICNQRGKNVLLGNSCSLPFQNDCFDYCICVAVLHHLSSPERRKQCVDEMLRVLKPNGSCVFNVWSYENQTKKKFVVGDNYVPWVSRDKDRDVKLRYYHIMNEDIFNSFINQFCDRVSIEKKFNQLGNWIVIFKKKKICH